MHVEVPRQVKRLRVEVLPLFPAVGPAGGGSGCTPRRAVRAINLHDRIDAELAQLAEGVIERNDVCAVRRVVLVAVFEMWPVDVADVQRIGPQRGPPGHKACLRIDAVAPHTVVVGAFNGRRSRPDARAVYARVAPPVGRVAAGHEMPAVVADNFRRAAGDTCTCGDVDRAC
jgi:hypothetical protein